MEFVRDEGINLRKGDYHQVHCYKGESDFIGELCEPHYHRYIEILYCMSGTIKVWINGNILFLQKGDLLLINSGVAHATYSVSSYSYIAIKFFMEILKCESCVLNETKYLIPLCRKDFQSKHFLKKVDISDSHIKSLVLSIYDEWNNESFGFELAIRSRILQLFTEIIRIWDSSDPYDFTSQFDETVRTILSAAEYCADNYATVTIDEIAKKSGMSYSYFSRIFKKIMNINFTQYINDLKIAAATNLLLTTDFTSTHIAYETGFSSTSHFICNFKKKTGFSPTEYKHNFKKSLQSN